MDFVYKTLGRFAEWMGLTILSPWLPMVEMIVLNEISSGRLLGSVGNVLSLAFIIVVFQDRDTIGC